MDQKASKINTFPNYKRIYTDLIDRKYSHKKSVCEDILKKEQLSLLDVLKLNELLFKNVSREKLQMNQKYRSYDKATILEILRYQKENGLNNSQLANHFKLSRNTIRSWRKLFELTE